MLNGKTANGFAFLLASSRNNDSFDAARVCGGAGANEPLCLEFHDLDDLLLVGELLKKVLGQRFEVWILFIVSVIRQKKSDILSIMRGLQEQDLKGVNAKLERSNLLLDVSQPLSDTAGWEADLVTGEVFWTRQNYLLYEVENDFISTLDNTSAFYEAEERARMDSAAEEAIRKKIPYDIELQVVTAKGTRKWVRAIGVPIVTD